jgi:hypothetical protein
MKNIKKGFTVICLVLFVTMMFVRCDEGGEVEPENKGSVNFEMTDAPIDDANVQGAFVTVASVKVDGENYGGFTGKQTIDLLAYQNGNTKALGLGELEAGTYTNISLVLDYEADADGNSPGCYILTTDNAKHDLSSSASGTKEIFVDGAVTVTKDATSTMVLDFDVRKAITYDSQGEFKFVSDAEMSSAVRMEDKPTTAKIKGEISGNTSSSNQLIVYAYKKGTFDRDTETSGQGESNIEFKNAVTSAVVDANGSYTLAFLDSSDEYEMHCVSYEDTNNDGKLEAQATANLEASILLNLNLFGLSLESSNTLTLDLIITGFVSI